MTHFVRNLLAVTLLITAVAGAPAQTLADPAKAAKSEKIVQKIRQMELLNILMPIGLTKEQIRAILPAIEKARQNSRTITGLEADDLAKLEPKLDEQIRRGMEEGKYPEEEVFLYVQKFVRAQMLRRQAAMAENVDTVYEVVEKQLNEGQRKVMAKIIDPRKYNPDIKEELDDKRRVRFFISDVLLDPLSYDILITLARRQS